MSGAGPADPPGRREDRAMRADDALQLFDRLLFGEAQRRASWSRIYLRPPRLGLREVEEVPPLITSVVGSAIGR